MQVIKKAENGLPSAKQARSLKELAAELKLNASSQTDIAISYLYQALAGFERDSVLSPVLDKLGHMDAVALTRTLCIKGSSAEKMRMTRYLGHKQALALPGIVIEAGGSNDNTAYSTATAFLSAHIEDLAQFLGAEVTAPIQQVSEAIIEAYAQFSLLDFVLFFNLAKKGQYQNNYQHVAGRGLNTQFLMLWLDIYAEARQLEIDNLRLEAKNFYLDIAVSGRMNDIAAKIEAAAAKQKHIRDAIKELRGQWWKEAVSDWKLQLHLFCSWAFPDNPRLAWVATKAFMDSRIQNLSRFDGVKTRSGLFQAGSITTTNTEGEIVTNQGSIYADLEIEFNAENYRLAVLTPVISAITGKCARLGAGGLVMEAINNVIADKQLSTPDQLWLELYPALAMPGTYSGHDIAKIAGVITSQITVQIERTWPRYRDDMLTTPDALPFLEQEFSIMQAVAWLQHVGLPNPLQTDLQVCINFSQ